jgi:thymidylate synthase
MRIFKTFDEARGEIKRDLAEMGIKIENERMQDKVGSFPTLELINYGYLVTQPLFGDLRPVQPWASREWEDRLNGIESNPSPLGTAWTSRSDQHMNWEEFVEYDGKPLPIGVTLNTARETWPSANNDPIRFAYTYGERFALNDQVLRVIRELRRNPFSRQLYVALWDPDVDIERLSVRRVPCSIGWHFMFRHNKLHVTYTMRSCDFVTHWENDVWLSMKLLEYVAGKVGAEVGQFSQFINSFHVYEKDVKDVF